MNAAFGGSATVDPTPAPTPPPPPATSLSFPVLPQSDIDQVAAVSWAWLGDRTSSLSPSPQLYILRPRLATAR